MLPWPLDGLMKKWYRKYIFKKVVNKIDSINKKEKTYCEKIKLKIWVSKDYYCAALAIFSDFLKIPSKKERSLLIQISGNMTKNIPLRLSINVPELICYLSERGFDNEIILRNEQNLLKLMYLIDNYIEFMRLDQDSQNFVNDFFVLIDLIDILNKFLIQRFSSICVFSSVVNLKYYWRSKNYEYLKSYYIENKDYFSLVELQETLQYCDRFNSKFNFRFFLVMLPITDNAPNLLYVHHQMSIPRNPQTTVQKPYKISQCYQNNQQKVVNGPENQRYDLGALCNLRLKNDLADNQISFKKFVDDQTKKTKFFTKILIFISKIENFLTGSFSIDLPILLKVIIFMFAQ